MGNTPFQFNTQPPQVSYAVEDVQPPTGLAVSTNDNLVIKVHNSNAAPALHVFVRLLLPDGTVSPSDFSITPDATRAVNTFSFPLDEGFLLSAVVFAANTGVLRGQCYCRLMVWRGSLTQSFAGYMLCEGYVTTATSISFPNGPNAYAVSGRGAMRSITGSVPAAGANISETVPTNAVWRLVSVFFSFQASAALGTRQVFLAITDGTNELARSAGSATVVANGTLKFVFTDQITQATVAAGFALWTVPLSMYLSAGFKFTTVTTSLDAGDQFTAPQYLVEEWILT